MGDLSGREVQDMDTKEMIGSRIREIRTKKGMTQEALAEKMGINPKFISSIERGKENPTLNTIINLADSLGVPIGEVFSFLELQDTSKRPAGIRELVKNAEPEELKLILKVVSVVMY